MDKLKLLHWFLIKKATFESIVNWYAETQYCFKLYFILMSLCVSWTSPMLEASVLRYTRHFFGSIWFLVASSLSRDNTAHLYHPMHQLVVYFLLQNRPHRVQQSCPVVITIFPSTDDESNCVIVMSFKNTLFVCKGHHTILQLIVFIASYFDFRHALSVRMLPSWDHVGMAS